MIRTPIFFFIFLLFFSNIAFSQFSKENIIVSCNACEPRSVFSADMDNDGDMDILSASYEDGKIAWYRNERQGIFSEQILISNSVLWATSVNASDFDGDDDMDVLSASFEGTIILHKNDGESNFSEEKIISMNIEGIHQVFSADIDMDGDIDIVTASINSIIWLENDGNGNFSQEKDISSQGNKLDDVYGIDLDEDGDLDVVLASENNLIWYENNGLGVFSKKIIPSTISPSSVFCIDLDGDKDIDILVASYKERVLIWYENNGQGEFSQQKFIASTSSTSGRIAHALDVDGDGDIDIVNDFPYSAKGMSWLENDGEENFSLEGGYPTKNVISFGSNSPRSIFNVDINGDGNMDLIYCDEVLNIIGWYGNFGNGEFSENIISSGAVRVSDVRSEDIDGDGDMDVISASDSDYKVAWYKNKNGSKVFEEKLIAYSYNAGTVLNTSDFDGDGDLDVVSAAFDFSDGHISWYENDGKGNFINEIIIQSGVSGMKDLYSVDLDSDDDIDILFASNYDDVIGWHENDGQGNFLKEKIIANINSARSVFSVDIDNDGSNDVLFASPNNSILGWYKNDGNENFTQKRIDSSSGNANRVYSVDLDKDGDMDVFSLSFSNDKISWYENLGQGVFSNEIFIAQNVNGINSIHVIDLDGDNDKDILSSSYFGDKVIWFENDGYNEFSQKKIIDDEVNGVSSIYPTDLDNDGDLDILSASEYDDKVAWYENLFNYPSISGAAFWDENGNGIRDSSERILKNFPVEIMPNALSSYTDAKGVFRFYVANNTSYTVTVGPDSCWQLSTDSFTYHVTLLGNISSGMNFGFHLASDELHTQARITSTPTRCSFEVPFWLSIENDGCQLAKGQYGIVLSPLVTLLKKELEPSEIRGDTLLWDYEELIASETKDIQFIFEISGIDFIGEIIHLTALSYIENEQGNLELSSTYDYRSEIRCAYDPNDKLVTPNRLTDYDQNYTLFEEPLEYTIRFQNTGNDTAFNVVIRDTLDNNLDWTTFKPILASHPFETLMHKDRQVEFLFKNILLPDSTTNEIESHGFLTYKILPKEDLPENTVIENTAGIYFDFNPPIITNTTRNVLVSELPKTTSFHDFSEQLVKVYPNPFGDFLTIEQEIYQDNELPQLSIFDMTGRLIQSTVLKNTTQQISTAHLANGLYFYQVLNADGLMIANGKVVKY